MNFGRPRIVALELHAGRPLEAEVPREVETEPLHLLVVEHPALGGDAVLRFEARPRHREQIGAPERSERTSTVYSSPGRYSWMSMSRAGSVWNSSSSRVAQRWVSRLPFPKTGFTKQGNRVPGLGITAGFRQREDPLRLQIELPLVLAGGHGVGVAHGHHHAHRLELALVPGELVDVEARGREDDADVLVFDQPPDGGEEGGVLRPRHHAKRVGEVEPRGQTLGVGGDDPTVEPPHPQRLDGADGGGSTSARHQHRHGHARPLDYSLIWGNWSQTRSLRAQHFVHFGKMPCSLRVRRNVWYASPFQSLLNGA